MFSNKPNANKPLRPELSGPSSYATRVKAITNNAQRNVESKEIAQLKEVSVVIYLE